LPPERTSAEPSAHAAGRRPGPAWTGYLGGQVSVEQHEYFTRPFPTSRKRAVHLTFANDGARMCQEMARGASANPDHFRSPGAPCTLGGWNSPRRAPAQCRPAIQILKCLVDGRRGIWPRLPPDIALGDRTVSVGGRHRRARDRMHPKLM
jgi:hypothetical protein